jgi:hypothetical protein
MSEKAAVELIRELPKRPRAAAAWLLVLLLVAGWGATAVLSVLTFEPNRLRAEAEAGKAATASAREADSREHERVKYLEELAALRTRVRTVEQEANKAASDRAAADVRLRTAEAELRQAELRVVAQQVANAKAEADLKAAQAAATKANQVVADLRTVVEQTPPARPAAPPGRPAPRPAERFAAGADAQFTTAVGEGVLQDDDGRPFGRTRAVTFAKGEIVTVRAVEPDRIQIEDPGMTRVGWLPRQKAEELLAPLPKPRQKE